MNLKTVKFKGNTLNCLKFKRIVHKKDRLTAEHIHCIMTNVELAKMYEMLHRKFGTKEKLLAVKVPAKKVAPVKIKKPETVALFGCFDQEVEV